MSKEKEYRKKPVVIKAYITDKEMVIRTLEGNMRANIGDYIITGVNGEQYPCKPDIFTKTYEKVDELLYKQEKTDESITKPLVPLDFQRVLDLVHLMNYGSVFNGYSPEDLNLAQAICNKFGQSKKEKPVWAGAGHVLEFQDGRRGPIYTEINIGEGKAKECLGKDMWIEVYEVKK